jgi:two-component system phosphate regulon sensor histidine kinase PhoR
MELAQILLTFFAVLINIVAFRFVVKNYNKSKELLILAVLFFCNIAWAIKGTVSFLGLIPENFFYNFSRFGDSLAVIIVTLYFYFIYFSFGFKQKKLLAYTVLGIAFIFELFILFYPPFYQGFRIDPVFGFDDNPGTVKYFFYAWLSIVFLMLVSMVFITLQKALKEKNEILVKKCKIILIWSVVGIFLALTSEVFLPLFIDIYFPLGGLGATLFTIAIVYAVYKFRFLDIRPKQFSIFSKIFYSFLFLIIISVVLLSMVLFQKSNNALKIRSVSLLHTVADLKHSQLELYIQESLSEIEAISLEGEIRDNLIEHLQSEISAKQEHNMIMHSHSRDLLKKTLKKEPKFEEFFILDQKGHVHLSTNQDQEGKIRKNENYFKFGIKAPYIESFHYSLSYEKPTVALSVPINSDEGQLVGVLVGHLKTDYINTIISELGEFGETGETLLANQNNFLVSNSRLDSNSAMKKSISNKTIQTCIANGMGNIEYIDYRNQAVVAEYRWIDSLNVCLLAKMDQREVTAHNRQLQKFIIAIGIFILLIQLLMSYFIARTITRPIEKLNKATKKLAVDPEKVKTEINSRDEIETLASSVSWAAKELMLAKKREKKYQQGLRDKVQERTSELNNALEKMKEKEKILQKQRKATLNILEDISESKENLKLTYDELERKNKTINTLKNISQELTLSSNIEKAIEVVIRYFENSFKFCRTTFLILDEPESGAIYQSHLFNEASEYRLSRDRWDLLSYLDKNILQNSNKIKLIVQNIEPKHSGKKVNNNAKNSHINFLYFPIVNKKTNYGLVQIAYPQKNKIDNDDLILLKAIIDAFTITVDTLQTIILAQQSKTVSLVESLKDGVMMYNDNRDFVLTNKTFSQFTGLSKKNFSLPELYRLIPESGLEDMVKASIEEGKISSITDVSLANKFFEIIVLPVKESQGKIVGGAIIIHDVTRLKTIDRMKTEFVSVASHQLRTPLTGIKLFTEMLIREQVGKLKKEQKEYLQNIYESTNRMVSLVNDLLNVSRIESGKIKLKPQSIDIIKLINEIVDEVLPLAEKKGQTISLNFKAKNLKIKHDKNLIRQAFNNLIVNAIRYSPGKKGKIEIFSKLEGKSIVISIKDNGIGIPKESQGRIFEKFFRAENAVITATEGTGLGLYTSKMIVELINGELWFVSEKNKGTTFFAKFPVDTSKK